MQAEVDEAELAAKEVVVVFGRTRKPCTVWHAMGRARGMVMRTGKDAWAHESRSSKSWRSPEVLTLQRWQFASEHHSKQASKLLSVSVKGMQTAGGGRARGVGAGGGRHTPQARHLHFAQLPPGLFGHHGLQSS